jgi:DnaJ-class molecular chaperone
MNDYEQYFTVLNLSNNATLQDIKKAYRTLSIKYHPDKNNNISPELFNKVNDAYIKLTTNFNIIQGCLHSHDTQLKQSMTIQKSNIYDPPLANFNPFSVNYNSHNNIEDITICLNITYSEAYNGASKPVIVERKLFTNNVISHETETLYVSISKGVDANEMIILNNKGNIYINGGTTSYSNIKIIIVLIKHECFERSGLDIIYLKTISLKDALVGFSFTITHINNKHYKIISNEIIDFNYVKIVNNLGFIRDSYTGNLIIKFSIYFPKTISQDNKALLQSLL